MFILPYVYHTRKLPHITIHIFTVLTVGGHGLWKEPDSLHVIEDVLQPNGFTPRSCTAYKDIFFCELDPSQINWSDYYDWKEVEDCSEVFCWRSFYLLGTTHTALSSWLPFPKTEGLGPYSYHELFTHIVMDKNTS